MPSRLAGDVFLLQTRDKRNPLVYAVFSTSRLSPPPTPPTMPSSASLSPHIVPSLSRQLSFPGLSCLRLHHGRHPPGFPGPLRTQGGSQLPVGVIPGTRAVPPPRHGMWHRGVPAAAISGFQYLRCGLWGARPHSASTAPPQCPSKTFGTFSSTKDFPDEVIQFARHHPLMYNPVLPHGQRPLFLQAAVPYTFTRIAVDRVTAADGHYDVLFIGTGMW